MSTCIYLAGPMQGYPEHNYPAFYEAADKLEQLGYEVINPAALNTLDTPRHVAMRKDLIALLRYADVIVTLPGWEDSDGANSEVGLGGVVGIPHEPIEHYLENQS